MNITKAEYFLSLVNDINEKWGVSDVVNPREKGKYTGVSQEELKKRLSALKSSGPHKQGSKEFGTMRELQFALRAKHGWGKVGA